MLYYNKFKSDLVIEGYCMYWEFEIVIKLEKNERVKGDDID